MACFVTALFTVEPGEVCYIKFKGSDVRVGVLYFFDGFGHVSLLCPDGRRDIVHDYSESALGGGCSIVDCLDPVASVDSGPGSIFFGFEGEDNVAIGKT